MTTPSRSTKRRLETSEVSIAAYLIRRLEDYGIKIALESQATTFWLFTAYWNKVQSIWSAARARTAPALQPTPMLGFTEWVRFV